MRSKSKNIVNIQQTEPSQKSKGNLPVSKLPIILNDAIERWSQKMKRKTGDKYFSAYRELSVLVGLAPSTLRSYTDEFVITTPTVDNLFKICLAIGDNTPLEFINDFQKALFEVKR